MMALMSTSLNVVSMAAVFCASLRRRAMVWRRRVMRTRSSRAASLGADGARSCVTGTGVVVIGGSAVGRRGEVAALRRGSAEPADAAITSSFRTWPRRPEPCTSAAERPFSSIILRAAGEGGMPPLPAGAAGAGWRRLPVPALRRLGAALRRLRRGAGAFVDGAQHRADADRRALRHLDVGEHAGGRRRHLHRHLVGLQLDQRLVDLDGLAGLLEPLADGRLRDGLAQRRHLDLDRHRIVTALIAAHVASACSTSVFCSWLCLLASPVAVAADGWRPT